MKNIEHSQNDYPYATVIAIGVLIAVLLSILLVIITILLTALFVKNGFALTVISPWLAFGLFKIVSEILGAMPIIVVIVCLLQMVIYNKKDYFRLALLGYSIHLISFFIPLILLIISSICFVKIKIDGNKNYFKIALFSCLLILIVFNVISTVTRFNFSNRIPFYLTTSVLSAIFTVLLGKFALPKQID